MDCITFTDNGDEESCEPVSALRHNLTQDLYNRHSPENGRIMVKDEDVCLHCGLCAERCRPARGTCKSSFSI